MRFHEFGDPGAPVVMLVHGGGNAWWNYLRQARVLAKRFRVILPMLDGHGEEYLSTEAETEKILEYIDEHCRGELRRRPYGHSRRSAVSCLRLLRYGKRHASLR